MLFEINLEKAFELIGQPCLIHREEIIPKYCPFIDHAVYKAEYNWLFYYERKLLRRLRPWLEDYRHELIGHGGILSESLSNSFTHGHKKNPEMPIQVVFYLGGQGLIIKIADQGKGFNSCKTFEEYKTKKQYYSHAGNGFRNMVANASFGVFYNQMGNIFHMFHLFSDELPVQLAFVV